MIKILFENSNFIVANKPENISFHSENGAGLAVLLEKQLGIKLYSVHRLDKMTSGLIIFAKSSNYANKFMHLFENAQIEKYYIAISSKKPKKKQGWIKGDTAKSRRGSYKLLKTKNNPARTEFVSCSLREHERLFLIKPHTGKTHQIRVALKSISSPVLGDIRYSSSAEAKEQERGYLHAYALRFMLNNELFSFVCMPDKGECFLSSECIEKLLYYAEPWDFFKKNSII